MDKKRREGTKLWASFYRANFHRFAEDYLGIKLKLFQMFLLFLMNHFLFFMYLAARGQGKSFIIAVYCVCRCILYPNSKILISSGVKNQAKLIITQKIKELERLFPNVRREIKTIKDSNQECMVEFHNTSTITAVVSNDNSRGYRGNILILDEFRLIKESVIKTVLQPFLNVVRQPPYLNNPKYAHLTEDNVEIYISSAWYKHHWMYEKFNAFKNAMLKGAEYFVCGLPFQLSVAENLMPQKRVDQLRNSDDFDEISWLMEMDCLFFGENGKAFFKLAWFENCRKLVKAWMPRKNEEFLKGNKKERSKKYFPKQAGEIRLVAMDIAMMEGTTNDQSVITLMRLLPNGDHYIRQVPYIETMSGAHSETQAIRLKQIFYDFEGDYVVMDTAGNGIAVYDDCAKVLYDEMRDEEYPAWSAMNDEAMKNRALSNSALPIIYSIKANGNNINHYVAMYLKDALEKRRIELLINNTDGKEYLVEKENFDNLKVEEQVELLKPYNQTTAMINETINLESDTSGGYVKLKEASGKRKDRYSSIGYANYYARILEMQNMREEQEWDEEDEVVYF